MRKLWWLFLFLGIFSVELSVFLPYLDSYFVSEDFYQLAFARFTENPFIVLHKPYYGDQFWRPLFQLLNALVWYVFGKNPAGYHVITMVVHSFNTALVAVLCYLILSASDAKAGWRFMASAAAALLFGLHPISSMTTIWFTCFEDLHGMFFLLLTLILVWHSRGGLSIIAFLTSMLALLSKETFFILPALALVIGLIRVNHEDSPLRQKIMSAVKSAAPTLAAFSCYMAWRMAVVGGIGGYEDLSLSPSYLLPRIAYHIPLVLERVSRDIAFYHIGSFDPSYKVLAAAYIVILGIGIILSVRRSLRLLLPLCIFALLTIAPLWSSSHMLAFREERLLYQSLLAAVLILGLFLTAPRWSYVKILMLAVSAVIIYQLASASGSALADWQKQAERNRSIIQALKSRLKNLPVNSRATRFYIVGLLPEDYALDPMIKIHLDSEQLHYSFMLGEYESLVWKPASVKDSDTLSKNIPAEALPKERGFFSNPRRYLASYAPPDLLIASLSDPKAAIYEWKDDILIDIKGDLRKLLFRRKQFQKNYNYPEYEARLEMGRYVRSRYLYLPSFSFYLPALSGQWKISPGLSYGPGQFPGESQGYIAVSNDPFLVSPPLSFLALPAAAVEIELKLEPRKYLPPQELEGALYWMSIEDEDFSSSKQIRFKIKPDGKFHRYVLDLSRSLAWCRSGKISAIRIDPISYPGRFQLKRIEFLPANWEEFRSSDTKSE